MVTYTSSTNQMLYCEIYYPIVSYALYAIYAIKSDMPYKFPELCLASIYQTKIRKNSWHLSLSHHRVHKFPCKSYIFSIKSSYNLLSQLFFQTTSSSELYIPNTYEDVGYSQSEIYVAIPSTFQGNLS